MVMAEFVQLKCGSVKQVSDPQFTCVDFPKSTDGAVAAIEGRAYPAVVTAAAATLGTVVRWMRPAHAPIISLSSRAAGDTAVTMTVALTTNVPVPANGKLLVTLSGAGISLSGSATISALVGFPAGSAAITGTSDGPFVLTVTFTASIAANTAIMFTIPGVKNPTNVQLALNNVAAAMTSDGGPVIAGFTVALGFYPAISARVTGTSCTILESDRVASKFAASAAFAFKTTVNGAMNAGSIITLFYPPGFFAPAGASGVSISGTGVSGTASASTPTAIAIVVTLNAAASINANTLVTVTVSSLNMGNPTADSPLGVLIATSSDTVLSAGAPSGRIGSQPTMLSFAIADTDRIAMKSSVSATFSFRTTVGGTINANGAITLFYPTRFFVAMEAHALMSLTAVLMALPLSLQSQQAPSF